MVGHTCHPSTGEAEAGVNVVLGYIAKLYLQNTKPEDHACRALTVVPNTEHVLSSNRYYVVLSALVIMP
jgi:hypothetical protein